MVLVWNGFLYIIIITFISRKPARDGLHDSSIKSLNCYRADKAVVLEIDLIEWINLNLKEPLGKPVNKITVKQGKAVLGSRN